jgi:hypothetical protein
MHESGFCSATSIAQSAFHLSSRPKRSVVERSAVRRLFPGNVFLAERPQPKRKDRKPALEKKAFRAFRALFFGIGD